MNLRLSVMKRFVAVAVMPVAAAGCSSMLNTADESTFSCPGMPQGIICKTPMAVYKSTHQMPAPTENDLPIGATALPEKAARPEMIAMAHVKASPDVQPAQLMASMATGAVSRPVREPAKVMRIWVAPWIDKNDDLNFPGYLFTEVKPRTWTLGTKEFAGQGLTIPHRAVVAPTGVPREKVEAEGRQASATAVPGIPSASDIKLD